MAYNLTKHYQLSEPLLLTLSGASLLTMLLTYKLAADSGIAGKRAKASLFGVSATMFVLIAGMQLLAHAHNTGGIDIHLIDWEPLRQKWLGLYDEPGLTDDDKGIVAAMSSGMRDGLSPSLKAAYRNAGLSHVLALSGFHLSVIFSILSSLLLMKLAPLEYRRIAGTVIIAALWVFVLAAGAPKSLLRSIIMFTVMWLCYLSGRGYITLNSTAIALWAMLIADPFSITDIGFQLSFSCVIGISLLGVPLCGLFEGKNTLVRWLWNSFFISLSCCLFSMPIVALHFGKVPLAGIPASVIVCAIATVLLYVSVLWLLLAWLQPLHDILTPLAHHTASLMNNATHLFASMDWMTFMWRPNTLEIIAFYLCLGCLVGYIRTRRGLWAKWTTISLTLLLAASLLP